MPASKAQQKAVSKYMKENYDEIKVRVEKGKKDSIQAHATAHNESVNGFIGRAISEAMERDSSGTPPESRQNGPKSTAEAGVVSLPSETLEAAQRAAEAAGEATEQFISRAIINQTERDLAAKEGTYELRRHPDGSAVLPGFFEDYGVGEGGIIMDNPAGEDGV